MSVDLNVLESLSDPVLVVESGGGTAFGNDAWRGLARELGVQDSLAALFGPPASLLVAEALRKGRASAFLRPASGAAPDRGWRVTVNRLGAEDRVLVHLADLSQEMAWRHQLFLRNSELTVLNDIGTALAGTMEIPVLAQRIWEQTGRIMDNADFFLALREHGNAVVTFPLCVEDGCVVAEPDRHPFGPALTDLVLGTREPLLLDGDVAGQLGARGVPAPPRPVASLVAVPILSERDAFGVLAMMDRSRAGRFGRHELGILNVVATQAASAIRTAWLFAAMRLAYDELASAQGKLLESERLRGVTETVGALNHEVNNPLATITGSAQLLLRRSDLEADTRVKVERMLEAARRIQAVTGRMASLIQAHSRPYPGAVQILDLARSVTREEPAEDAGGSVEQVLRVMRETLPVSAPEARIP